MSGSRDLLSRLAAAREVVVFDLEFTAWEGSLARRWSGPGEHREIVQIGAVRIAPAAGFAEDGAFSVLARPRINPRLSAYFTALTGIDQARLDREAVALPEALARFAAFVGDAAAVLCNGADRAVVWENCALAGLAPPVPAALFHDVRDLLAAAAGRPGRPISSGDLHRHFPGVPVLAAHDALADARMVAAALRHAYGRMTT
ncbi:exonuclease domain-containing protein [Azospirillum sp. ST 5-10]|uniref:exonuclease domain-containing protein n=1 Tax=unclassified Azospirillum TaxID=2630922 RepID=UPI003F49BB87